MAERRTYQGFEYERTADGWKRVGVAQTGPAVAPIGGITIGTPDPTLSSKIKKTGNEAAASEYDPALAAAQLQAILLQNRMREKELNDPTVKYRALTDKASERLEGDVGTYASLKRSLGGFQDAYAGNTITGGLENAVQGVYGGFGTPGQRDWWADFRSTDNIIRNTLFGSALTPGEKQAYEATTISERMDPAEVRKNLERRAGIIEGALQRRVRGLKANKFDPQAVDAYLGEFAPVLNQQAGSVPNKDDRSPAVAAIGGIPNVAPPAGPDQIDPTGGSPLLSPQDRAFLSQNARTLGPDGVRQYVAARGLRIPENEIQAAFDYYSKGGSQNPVVNVPQGEGSALGRAVASPVGGFATTALDNLTAGNLDSVGGMLGFDPATIRAGLEAQSQTNPTASTLGSFAGALAGTELTGGLMAGLPVLSRLAKVGGGIIPDMAFGAATGAGTADDGDRLTGALTGAGLAGAGNVIGGAIVGGAGRAVRGVSAPAVRRLHEAGVPLTTGQIMGGSGVVGRTIKSLEDASESVPLLGSLIRTRRDEGIQGFNRAAFKEALEPINAQVQGTIGNDAIEQAQSLVGDAYTQALGGVNLTPDDAYQAAISQATATGQDLPGGLSGIFNAILKNRVTPQITETGMSGRGLQAALQGLRKDSGDVIRKGEIQGDLLKGATVDVEDALMDMAERQAPGTVSGLQDANSAFRNLSIIEDAALKADNAGGVFTPAQLGMATKQNAKRFGGKHAAARGDVPMRELQQAGQDILPSTMGNSGTTDRLLATAVLPGLLGGAAATGSATDYLSPEAAGGLGIMSALATRQGRNALQKLLVSRPEAARSIGDQIYNNRALGSMIGAPLLIAGGTQ